MYRRTEQRQPFSEVMQDTSYELRADHRAVFREIRNFLAGRFIGATRDEALLEEVLKCLYTKLYIENHPEECSSLLHELHRNDPVEFATECRKIFSKVRSAYPELFDTTSELLLDPTSLMFVMGKLLSISLINAERDAVADAFEVFIGDKIRGQEGQFFTPRNAVQLLVSCIEPSLSDIVLDPACGAGGFLSATVQKFLADGASLSQISDFVRNRLFGIDKDQYLARLARTHVALLCGEIPNVACADSLTWRSNGETSLSDWPSIGEYDIILTNPPFGSNIIAASQEVLANYELARKWRMDQKTGRYVATSALQRRVPPQVLFVERCIQLLKPGGRLGIVVPESLISSAKYKYVVDFITDKCTIEMVAGMPEELFKTSGKSGTHTKTSLLILVKKKKNAHDINRDKYIFMAEARWCGHDSRGRPIPYDDLPEIANRYLQARAGQRIEQSHLGFLIKPTLLIDKILAPRHYDPRIEKILKDLKETHLLIRVGELVEKGVLSISTGDEVGKLAYGTGDVPFVRTSDLSNWEIKIDPKHCVSEEIYDSLKQKQDVREGDILMVRDGTYLIGTCAIITRHDVKIVYQSHLYKIRIHPNELGLTPYLLLAILSSKPVQLQIRSKCVTQDIIDSLGDRINDIYLPIPKDTALREEISQIVERVIKSRVEARELARKAREMVAPLDGPQRT